MDINELLKQRELVMRHLRWLDAQVEKALSQDSAQAKTAAQNQSLAEKEWEPSETRTLASPISFSQKAGCIGILAILLILFLTLLFVIPLFVYR